MRLVDAFRQHLEGLGIAPGPALVAVSGGLDSVVLLDLLVTTQSTHGLELIVAHVDHGVADESHRVAQDVARLAADYGLPLRTTRLELGAQCSETEARRRRLAWLEGTRRAVGAVAVLLAHHADDQRETVLMRALAGSGLAGLAGMRPVRGMIARPLLPFTRRELAAYAEARGLRWWDDPANTDPRHLRSWLRTDILPMVRDRVPQVDAHLDRLREAAHNDRQAWNAMLEVLPDLGYRRESDGCSVAAEPLVRYDDELAVALIRAAALRAGHVVGSTRAQRIVRLAHRGQSGRHVELGGGWVAELAFDRLRIVDPGALPAWEAVRVPLGAVASAPITMGRWTVNRTPEPAPAHHPRRSATAWFPPGELLIRTARPGERVRPLGGAGRCRVVRCFQEARVPKSRRSQWPLFEAAGEVVWIPGVCRSSALVPGQGTEAMRVDVEFH